ncbi:MAG: AMP-binding protein [Acidimicrobiia bacterium]|nr:AMP-binding protein [Acidimicrobiia bacterium]
MNLATIIDPHPADAVAYISRGVATTYGELRRHVGGLAGGLAALGLEPGERLAVLCANNGFFVTSYLAGLAAGLVVVPLNPASPAAELGEALALVGAAAVVVGPSARASFAEVDRRALPALREVIACGESSAPHRSFAEVAAAPPMATIERAADDLAVLMFTSGTAGTPRAAMLTHGNLLANLGAANRPADEVGIDRAADVVFGVLPLHHIFGLNVALGATLRAGASIVLIERFDPTSAVETVQSRGVTVLAGPPTMWAALAGLGSVPPEAFGSVRVAVSGAAPLAPATRDAVRERLGLDLDEGYGLTEAAPTVTTTVGSPPRAGSVGRPPPGVTVRLVDEDGRDVEPGDPGEIWVSGPSVFVGYWDDPAATAEVLTADGWLRTGDLAMADDDGYLYLVDRIKDLVIVSGFNVSPAEVENALLRHPGVARAAVIGVEHPHTGEALKAFVVVEPASALEEDELIAFCATRLARYKCPRKVQFVDELPEGSTGKVLRRELRG